MNSQIKIERCEGLPFAVFYNDSGPQFVRLEVAPGPDCPIWLLYAELHAINALDHGHIQNVDDVWRIIQAHRPADADGMPDVRTTPAIDLEAVYATLIDAYLDAELSIASEKGHG